MKIKVHNRPMKTVETHEIGCPIFISGDAPSNAKYLGHKKPFRGITPLVVARMEAPSKVTEFLTGKVIAVHEGDVIVSFHWSSYHPDSYQGVLNWETTKDGEKNLQATIVATLKLLKE